MFSQLYCYHFLKNITIDLIERLLPVDNNLTSILVLCHCLHYVTGTETTDKTITAPTEIFVNVTTLPQI